ncbi:nucleotidyltransferase [Telluribacter sp. SYSU D00476]|uniref:nucleotidyltransferase n=1 Tax=Telluribacter sp. SYSU D00476 TaxID=2811430 RepID=UPI001FF25E91|nr:nucleotidyltransferase [Telluribacter sp. SYSU D00476]
MIVTEEQREQSQAFYREALTMLNECGTRYMLGGAFAMFHYTGIYRDTKDLDIFCKPSEYPKILKHFADKGFETQLTDVRWLAKVFNGEYFIDIIFDTVNNICTVDDSWYEHASRAQFAGVDVLFLPPEELIWCKMYVQNRERYDGADVNHIILRYGKNMDWKRVLFRMDPHWHLLLAQLLLFQFVYPSDYHDIIPKWLFDELMERAHEQYDLPPALEKVCRGPVIDQTQYMVDIKEWDYKVSTIKTT